jgi:hypothetical protein
MYRLPVADRSSYHERPPTPKARRCARVFLAPWSVVLVAATLYLGVIVALHGGDPLALATLGTQFSEGDPGGTEGYDGQFVYYIARDPLGGWRHCDVPAYRYQRILYPLLARLLAFGQEALIPYTLPLLNLGALAAGTWLTEQILRRHRVSRWYALTYGLYAGQLMAVRLNLSEPLSFALVQAAILAAEQGRWRWSVQFFALAVLARETALVFVGGYLLALLLRREGRHFAGLALGTGLPFLAWQAILWAWFGRPGLGSGGAGATGWEILPFRGLWSVGAIDMRALALLALVMIPLAVVPAMLGLWAAGRDLGHGRWQPVVGMLLTNALIILFLPQSSFREPLAMLRLTSGLMITTILYGAARRSKRVLNYTLLWLATMVFLFKEGPMP